MIDFLKDVLLQLLAAVVGGVVGVEYQRFRRRRREAPEPTLTSKEPTKPPPRPSLTKDPARMLGHPHLAPAAKGTPPSMPVEIPFYDRAGWWQLLAVTLAGSTALVFISTTLVDWALAGFLGTLEQIEATVGWTFPDWLDAFALPAVDGGLATFWVLICTIAAGELAVAGKEDLGLGLPEVITELCAGFPGTFGDLIGQTIEIMLLLMFLWLFCHTVAALIPVINEALNWSIPYNGVDALLVIAIAVVLSLVKFVNEF